MRFFFGKKEEEDTFFVLEDPQTEKNPPESEAPSHPSALTVEEIRDEGMIAFGKNASNPVPNHALDSLKERMRSTLQERQTDQAEPFQEESKPDAEAQKQAVFENAKEAIEKAAEEEEPLLQPEPGEDERTLLEKCRPYIVDENGNNAAEEKPTYQLESVADILSANSKTTLERLSENYGISFDDLHTLSQNGMILEENLAEPASEPPEEPREEEPQATPDPVAYVSDIDAAESPVPEEATGETATIRFTPVADAGNTSSIRISSTTKTIDLTGELSEFLGHDDEQAETGELKLERTEFDEYVPEEEFHTKDDLKKIRRLLSLRKRNCFLKCVGAVLLALVPTLFLLPVMSGAILSNMRPFMITATVMAFLLILLNYDMFASIPKMFSRHSSADIAVVTASLAVMAYAIVGIIKNEYVLELLVLVSLTLAVRSLCAFFHSSWMLSNFLQIASKAPKRAVKLIDETAVTFAMAKNSIEGDVLIAAPQKTEHVDDYMKYSTFRVFLNGRMPVITVASVLLSLILGFASASYFDGVIYGFYSAAVIQCLCAVPFLFFIDTLPLFSAAKRLNKLGSMIAGKAGAEALANANAVVLHSEDIFPAGTVTLYQMKVLSDNSIDVTIVRAAALTDAMNSPLSPIFKRIAGTGGSTILPESDTVKYEDKMGISGWVDNRLLFIGNRTLMEAHGISVPSVEVDRKLLRNGYFPIYVSDADKACALLAVQYTVRPEIAHELRRLASLGITMLVDSSDPNMTEEMICDYMGLPYEDSVKVMSSAGCHMYHNAVPKTPSISAPAAYKGNPIGLIAIVNAANRIRKSNLFLTVLYIVAAVLGTVLFTYMSFDGQGSLVSGMMLLAYEGIATAAAYLLYLLEKP